MPSAQGAQRDDYERDGIGVCAHAPTVRLCDAGPMARPKPSAIPPDRSPPKKIPPTPEQLAKAAVAKRPAVMGRPDRVEVALRFTLSRAAMERLTTRAIREGRSLESLIAELLEGEGAA